MNLAELLVFKSNDHWTIAFNNQNHGLYPSKAEALKVARIWAENARQQGHNVELTATDEGGIVESATYRPDGQAPHIV